MMRYLIPIVLLAGCTSLPSAYDPSKLSPEQIKATVADKSATVACGLVTGTYGRATTVYVNLDKTSVVDGTVTVNAECVTTVTLTAPHKAASSP